VLLLSCRRFQNGEITMDDAFGTLLIAVLGVLVYFLPYLAACAKKKANRKEIGRINLWFGWTVLGWIFALVWASIPDNPTTTAQVQASTTTVIPNDHVTALNLSK
jgi:hypothetical protein